MDKDPKKVFDESLAIGWKMKKLIHAGIFNDTYDVRTVYNRKDLGKLINEGFYLAEDAGILALNILKKI